MPRDAPVARSILILTAIHVGLAGSWHAAWAMAGGTLAHVLSRRRPRQLLDLWKKLRDAGIVGSERRGLWAYYYVKTEAMKEISTWLS